FLDGPLEIDDCHASWKIIRARRSDAGLILTAEGDILGRRRLAGGFRDLVNCDSNEPPPTSMTVALGTLMRREPALIRTNFVVGHHRQADRRSAPRHRALDETSDPKIRNFRLRVAASSEPGFLGSTASHQIGAARLWYPKATKSLDGGTRQTRHAL